ncbi:hypothetical protein HUJ05_001520 [Dendroctonus ponderosae]|nr:hypothetical protein HUJ05_001520 [Dendroctonus ponderosae]
MDTENVTAEVLGVVPVNFSSLLYLQSSQIRGKSTGIVTNTRITHATPAALYGHAPSRYWEDDSKVPPASRKSCKDLARQLIENDPGRNINARFVAFAWHENIVGRVSN